MDDVKVTAEPLRVGEIYDSVTHPSTGAVSLFVGTTRDNFQGKRVICLEYEAYEPMAVKKLGELCGQVRAKWPDVHNVAVHHRVGVVGPAEASVVIAVTSPHRQTSLDAVAFAIDELKASVPIWKKEQYEDGSTWKENKECKWATSNNQTQMEVEVDKPPEVDPSLVQIHASNEEIERRMEAFMARKRAENDVSNVLEFCGRTPTDTADEFSCARTDSVLIRKQCMASQSNTSPSSRKENENASHLRKSVVDNTGYGPDYDKATSSGQPSKKRLAAKDADGVKERVKHLEDHLSLGQAAGKPVPPDFYARLKDIEDRVMFLEGVSPEYFPLFSQSSGALGGGQPNGVIDTNNPSLNQNQMMPGGTAETAKQREYKEKLTQSLSTINKRIQELQAKLVKS